MAPLLPPLQDTLVWVVAVVMADGDPPVEVSMNAQMFWSLRKNVLNLWLSIALPLWDFVFQNLTDVNRSRLDLRTIGKIDSWQLDGTRSTMPNLILQVWRKCGFEVRLPFLVFSIPQSVSGATVIQDVSGDRVPRTKLNIGLFETSVDRRAGMITDRVACVTDHLIRK